VTILLHYNNSTVYLSDDSVALQHIYFPADCIILALKCNRSL